mmetsp:Transcript_11876/g.32114  ORF Transcript_11876/g.32114 Transcript_11876/m.32114 type:complete len:495 (-) Transcript_11876:529-2013(-)
MKRHSHAPPPHTHTHTHAHMHTCSNAHIPSLFSLPSALSLFFLYSTTQLDEVSAGIIHMLKAAAGFYSAELDTQASVEASLTAIVKHAPILIETCQHNQAVMRAMSGAMSLPSSSAHLSEVEEARSARVQRARQHGGKRGGREEEEENEEGERGQHPAVTKARAAAQLATYPSQSVFPHLLSDLRREVEAELRDMQEEMEKVEEEESNRAGAANAEKGGMPSARDYLLSMQKMGVEKTAVALPHLIRMSSQLDIDLLSLSSKELEGVLGVRGMGDVLSTSAALLRLVQTHCKEIRSMHESSSSSPPPPICSTSALSSFLSGKVAAGMEDDPLLMHALSTLASTHTCSASGWRVDLDEGWTYLELTCSHWLEMEERMGRAAREETSMDKLKALVSELDQSSLTNDDLRARLVSRMLALTNVAVGDVCVMCGERGIAVRFFPCRHSCACVECVMRELSSEEEKESLTSMGFVSLKGSDTKLACFECGRQAMSITSL